MDDTIHTYMYPIGASSAKSYGLPKIHKKDIPLSSFLLSRNSVKYGGAKELVGILQPLVGKSQYHIQNSQIFAESIKDITLLPGECITSYDVTALFTSVPVDPALDIIKNKLPQEHTLSQRTRLTTQHIIELLGFCLHSIYFMFHGNYYKQVEGAAMGSPVSPIGPIYTWISLKKKHSEQHRTLPDFRKG